jgi:hypothetical protein
MCSKFTKTMVQTFIGSAAGSMLSQAMGRGIAGAQTPIDWVDTAINGLKTGTAFIAYPVAVRTLSNACPTYKQAVECPTAPKAKVYILGGSLAALICTAVSFPLGKMQACRSGKACTMKERNLANCATEFAGAYADQIGISIGFAATMGTLAPLVPIPKNSILAWIRQSSLVQISNMGGRVFAFPIHKIRRGATLGGMLGGYLKNWHGVLITGDACNYYKGVLQSITE